MTHGELIEKLVAIFALIVLIGGSLLVLAPFTTALLWAAILAFSSWYPYTVLTRWFGNRRSLAALVCVLLSAVIVLGPFVYAGASFTANIDELSAIIDRFVERGAPQLPVWIGSLPVVGPQLSETWDKLIHADSEALASLRRLMAPVGHLVLAAGLSLGAGLGQLALSIILAFFFYTGGDYALSWLRAGMRRISGARADHLLALAGSTIQGVVYGVLGTAFVQAILAGIGFWIAGVPGAAILAFITFFLSVIPMGPPLVWVPAALWLYHSGETGWALFIVAWGVVVVGMADNVIKPLLISKGTDMPLIWVMLGVLGGALAFGFLGVFIGPTLLAVAYAVLRDWTIGPMANPNLPLPPRDGVPEPVPPGVPPGVAPGTGPGTGPGIAPESTLEEPAPGTPGVPRNAGGNGQHGI